MKDLFYSGFFWGLFVAGGLGYIFRKIQTALRDSKKHKVPLSSFPDSAQPNMTSGGVVRDCWKARIGCFFWVIAFVSFVLFVYWITPEVRIFFRSI